MIDFSVLRSAVITSVKDIIGADLYQRDIPGTDPVETEGVVIFARPSRDAPIPDYPYAMIDMLSVEDDDGHLEGTYYDDNQGGLVYETTKIITFQITVIGGRTLELAQKLETGYRLDSIIQSLRLNDIGILDTQLVNSIPKFYDTDFVEQSVFLLELRVKDVELVVDVEHGTYIQIVAADGEIRHDPDDVAYLAVDIDVDSANP